MFKVDYRAIILDCDGVIFDINKEKSLAFASALSPYPPQKVDVFVRKHKETGGVSRYEKFSWFFNELCLVENPDEAVEMALSDYALMVQKAYGDLKPVPQAMDFVRAMKKKVPVFVASGSDQKELREVFSDHGVSSHFENILGSPTSKTQNVKSILKTHGLTPGEVLFIGDGGGDYQTTLELQMPFIHLGEMSEWTPSVDDVKRHPEMRLRATWSEILEDFSVS